MAGMPDSWNSPWRFRLKCRILSEDEMKILKLFFVTLVLFSLIACGQTAPVADTPATIIPPQPAPVEATQPPAVAANSTAVPAAATQVAVIDVTYGVIARAHIVSITDQFGARWTGTEAEANTAHYIEEEFAKMGYEPEIKSFSRLGWEDDETQAMFDSANVIAVKEGASPEVIVVGAHYDSSDEGLGADDNASGVGALLELAQIVKDVSTPYTIHFVAFGGEEAGMLGSQDYVDNLGAEGVKNTIGLINMDSISAGDITYAYSKESESALRDWALDWAKANGFALETIPNVDLSDEGYGTADYDAFEKAGIPFAYFESTNWTLGDKDGYTQVDPQYGDGGAIIHTEFDTLAYLDETFPGRVDERLNNIISIIHALLTQYTIDS
jgi:Zn-dependent M28 family amino/carboxypeptidase